MYSLIRILTQGETRHEAHDNALAFASELVDRDDFDFYDGQRARTYTLASALGKKAMEYALAGNRCEFDVALQAARLMLQEFTDEQIDQDDYPLEPREYYASRWQFSQVGDGISYLYGDEGMWGEKIRNEKVYQTATADCDILWVT
jgi:hypothetical protein